MTITSVARNTVFVRVIKELPGEVALRLRPGRYEVSSSCRKNESTPVTVKRGRRTVITLSCGTSIK